MPGVANEHSARYTRTGLIGLLEHKGLTHEATRYIARAELIMAFRRPVQALNCGVELGSVAPLPHPGRPILQT